MKIEWTTKEIDTLSKMEIPFDFKKSLSDVMLEDLYDIVPDYLMAHGLGKESEINSDGRICEDIITKLSKIMDKKGLLA